MNEVLSLADYIEILKRRAWLIVALTGVAVAAALVFSGLQTPMYRSSASILINQTSADEIFDPVTGVPFNQADRVAANELRLLESTLVTDATGERLGLDVGTRPTSDVRVSARVESSADVLVTTAVDADPQRAQEVAQAYAETYLELRQEQYVSERLDTADKLRQRISELDDEIAVQQADGAAASDLRRNLALRDDLEDSFDRLEITAELGTSGRGQIIDVAEFPSQPFQPQTTRNVIAALMLGLLAGVGGALVLHSLDRSVKSRAVVEAATGLSVLGSLPKVNARRKQSREQETEAIRSLRASLDFATADGDVQIIQLTSPGPWAGKTTVSGNLAIALAQAGRSVAVVDGDLRRPRLHSVFGLPQEPGLTSAIIRRNSIAQTMRTIERGGSTIHVIPSGPTPPGPPELLGSEQTVTVFEELRKLVDVVIVDSAPVLPVADSLVLSKVVDAVIVVANAQRTKRPELVATVEKLRSADARLLGIVLNQVTERRGFLGYGYGYGYGTGYGGAESSTVMRRRSVARHPGTLALDEDDVPALTPSTASASPVAAHPVDLAETETAELDRADVDSAEANNEGDRPAPARSKAPKPDRAKGERRARRKKSKPSTPDHSTTVDTGRSKEDGSASVADDQEAKASAFTSQANTDGSARKRQRASSRAPQDQPRAKALPGEAFADNILFRDNGAQNGSTGQIDESASDLGTGWTQSLLGDDETVRRVPSKDQ